MISLCNRPDVGYSQEYRNGEVVNGIEHYDCSSSVYWSLVKGGFPLDPNGNAFTTRTMGKILLQIGFKIVPISGAWKAGDILLRSGHTEMVYNSNRVTMGAHSNNRPLADQVSINNYASKPSEWTTCYRYQGGAVNGNFDWIYGNRYLNDAEMANNAYIVFIELTARGWTLNAIAGLLGNMESESTINPAIWESLNEGNTAGGYGLVQWTPSTNYTSWANSKGYNIKDGNKQLQWIDEETVKEGQWIATNEYPLPFSDFKTSYAEPEYLASAFLKNFERAGVEVENERKQQARKWFNVLIDYDGSQPIWGHGKRKTKGYNFLLFNAGRKRNGKKRNH